MPAQYTALTYLRHLLIAAEADDKTLRVLINGVPPTVTVLEIHTDFLLVKISGASVPSMMLWPHVQSIHLVSSAAENGAG